MAQARRLPRRLVEHGLHGYGPAAPQAPVGRDHGDCRGVVQPRRNGGGTEAGEQWQRNAAEPRQREKSDGHLRAHRQIDADRVAAFDAKRAETRGEAIDLSRQLPVAERAARRVFTLPHDGRVIATAGLDMTIEQAQRDVGRRADAPLRPFDSPRLIEDPRIGLDEFQAEKADQRIPEPLRFAYSLAFEKRIARDILRCQKRAPIGLALERLAGLPYEGRGRLDPGLVLRHRRRLPCHRSRWR